MTLGHGEINIPPPGLSMGADIYRQFRLGEITRGDYFVFNASMTASLSHEERPRVYAPIPGAAKAYVDGRLVGNLEFEQARARLLGQWRWDVFRAFDTNQCSVDHLNWAYGKLKTVGLSSEMEKVQTALRRFDLFPFPAETYERACAVLKMDADDRQRASRE